MKRYSIENFNFLLTIFHITKVVISTELKIVYMDGQGKWDSCLPELKRSVTANSGLLISHSGYGTQPYNASKNCFLTITVPIEYRIRLKVLDFDVSGDWRHCATDTLHVFDHDEPLDPKQLERLPMVERSPGQIIGQLCGTLPPVPPQLRFNATTSFWPTETTNVDGGRATKYPAEKWRDRIKDSIDTTLAESSHNALTVWWHTEVRRSAIAGSANGFRLMWSSYRVASSKDNNCDKEEFRCAAVAECIPISAACNSYADCLDASDTDVKLQVEYNCEDVPGGMFSQLTGFKKLLICVIFALGVACSCFFCCACFYVYRRPSGGIDSARSSDFSVQKQQVQQQQQHSSIMLPPSNKQDFGEKMQDFIFNQQENSAELLPQLTIEPISAVAATGAGAKQSLNGRLIEYSNANITDAYLQNQHQIQCANIIAQKILPQQQPLPPNFSPPQVPISQHQYSTNLAPNLYANTNTKLLKVQAHHHMSNMTLAVIPSEQQQQQTQKQIA